MYIERRNLTPEEGQILVITLETVVAMHMSNHQFLEAGRLNIILDQIKLRTGDLHD